MTERPSPRSRVGRQPAPALTITMRVHGSCAQVRLAGDLDLGTVPDLRSALEHVYEAGYRRVAVEISELGFLSATGLQALCDAARYCRASAGWLVLTHPTAQVRRLLRVTGLDGELIVHPSRGRPAAPVGVAATDRMPAPAQHEGRATARSTGDLESTTREG